MPIRTLVSVLLLTTACTVSAGEKTAPVLAGYRDPALLERVDRAVARGVTFLIQRQAEDGSIPISDSEASPWLKQWGMYRDGSTALALLALLKSGVSRNEIVIRRGFDYLRRQPITKTYSASLTLMALEARWTPQDVRGRIRGEAGEEAADAAPDLPESDLAWMAHLARYLLGIRVPSGARLANGRRFMARTVWNYPEGKPYGDHSNTQFALLGLRSAMRCGVPIEKSTWKEAWRGVIEHFLASQERDGPRVRRVGLIENERGEIRFAEQDATDDALGWAYLTHVVPWSLGGPRPEVKGFETELTGFTRTAIGVCSLRLALEGWAAASEGRPNAKLNEAVARSARSGYAFLARTYEWLLNEHGVSDSDVYYGLYSLERAAVLSGRRNLGAHDWYREGAEYLLANQAADGTWTGGCRQVSCGPVPGTAFSLLFLTKATRPVRGIVTPR